MAFKRGKFSKIQHVSQNASIARPVERRSNEKIKALQDQVPECLDRSHNRKTVRTKCSRNLKFKHPKGSIARAIAIFSSFQKVQNLVYLNYGSLSWFTTSFWRKCWTISFFNCKFNNSSPIKPTNKKETHFLFKN